MEETPGFKRWLESLERELPDSLSTEDRSRFRDLMGSARDLFPARADPLDPGAGAASAGGGAADSHREIERLNDLASHLVRLLTPHPCSRGEVLLAADLLTATTRRLLGGAGLELQTVLRRHQIVNEAFNEEQALVSAAFQPWVLSILDRAPGLRSASFWYRLVAGTPTALDFCCRAYRRLVQRIDRWDRKKKLEAERPGARELALRLALTFLSVSAASFSLAAGGRPRAHDDHMLLFLFEVRPNLDRRDPVALAMALGFLHEYVLLPARLVCVLDDPRPAREAVQDVDANLSSTWGSVWDGLRLESKLWTAQVFEGSTERACRCWQSAFALWSWWVESHDFEGFGARSLARFEPLVRLCEERARPTALWIWELCRIRSAGGSVESRSLDLEDPDTWLMELLKAAERDLGDAGLPYVLTARYLALSIPIETLAISMLLDAGDVRRAMLLAMGANDRGSAPLLPREGSRASSRIEFALKRHRTALEHVWLEELRTAREREKHRRLLSESYEAAYGSIPVVSSTYSLGRTAADARRIKRELTRTVVAAAAGRPREEAERRLDRLFRAQRDRGIDLLYVGFLTEGLSVVHLAGDGTGDAHVAEIGAYRRQPLLEFASESWYSLAFLPSDPGDPEGARAKAETVQAQLAFASAISDRVADLPLGPRVLVVAESPLQFLPLLPVLTLRVLHPRGSLGAFYDWAAEPGQPERRLTLETYAAGGLLELARDDVPIEDEVDWSALGLRGRPVLDPSPDELRQILTSGADVVHLATHGFFDHAFPLFSGLVARDLGRNRPDVAPVFLAELLGRRFDTRLAWLGACSTNPGGAFESSADLSLGRLLIAGGVDLVLGSLWAIDSRAAHEFTMRFKRVLGRGTSVAGAFSQALVHLAGSGAFERCLPFHLTTGSVDAAFRPVALPG